MQRDDVPSGWRRFLVLALLPLTACYSYTPLAEAPPPGTEVRTRLTAPGAIRLSEVTGQTDRAVTGRVVTLNDEVVVLAARRQDLPGNPEVGVGADTFRIPRNDVTVFEERRVSNLKTGLLIGGVAVATGVLAAVLLGQEAGGDNPENGGGGPVFSSGFSVPISR